LLNEVAVCTGGGNMRFSILIERVKLDEGFVTKILQSQLFAGIFSASYQR